MPVHRVLLTTSRIPSLARAARLVVLLASAAACGFAAAAEVYVSTGDQGEPSFSDEAGPGKQRLDLEVHAGVEDPLAELERRIAQTLAVAESLEASRLARERARAQDRERAAQARAAAQPQVRYQDRYVTVPYRYPQPRWPDRHPGFHHKPPHEAPVRPERPREQPGTVSKSFPAPD